MALKIFHSAFIFVFTFCFSTMQGQTVVNFTKAEGFTDGALYSDSNWDSSLTGGTWAIDATVGTVSTDTEWQWAVWGQAFTLTGKGDTVTFRTDFNFSGTLNDKNNPLMTFGFNPGATRNQTDDRQVFLRTANYNTQLQLAGDANVNPLSPNASLVIGDCQGDDLAVEVNLKLGSDAATSIISAKLINVTDGTETVVGSYTGISSALFTAATTTGINGAFQSFSFKSVKEGVALTAIAVSKVAMSTNVEILPTVKRTIGGVSVLDRSKYFNIHSTGNDVDDAFYTDYNVSRSGRGFWGPASAALQSTGEVGVYPAPKTGGTEVREVSRYISTEHPNKIYKEGIDPVLMANWAVEYFKNFVDVSLRPEYYEPMNEPFVHARNFYSEPDWDAVAEARVKLEMTQVFKHIGQKIHEAPELANIKVIGYASAYPSFEKNDFSIWESNMKMFMDEAGEHMDAFATHLYDGINQIGQDSKRSGSNLEAVLDLIETYSFSKWGTVKPHAISEFGGIEDALYNDISNMQSIRSQNAMLFGLLEREDRMEIAIPFTTGKSTWHLTSENNYMPYKAVLYKPIPMGVPLDQVTDWEFTDRIYFYDLWKEVNGERVLIKSDNPDIQVQAFVNGNKLYVALNNLDDNEQTVNLSLRGSLPSINNVRIKSLIVHSNKDSDYLDETVFTAPASYTLSLSETTVLEYTFSENILYDNSIHSERYYNSTHIQAIVANTETNFSFNNVNTGPGYATLCMSIGRKHDRSKSPIVKVNGTTITVPDNWKGYDQFNRDDFFGMIEIPVPIDIIQQNNNVSITFPDSGGHLSSLILRADIAENTITLSTEDTEFNFNNDILKLYPNPSTGIVYINGVLPDSNISVYSMEGRQVFSCKYNGISMNLDHLQRGIYIVKVNNSALKLILNH